MSGPHLLCSGENSKLEDQSQILAGLAQAQLLSTVGKKHHQRDESTVAVPWPDPVPGALPAAVRSTLGQNIDVRSETHCPVSIWEPLRSAFKFISVCTIVLDCSIPTSPAELMREYSTCIQGISHRNQRPSLYAHRLMRQELDLELKVPNFLSWTSLASPRSKSEKATQVLENRATWLIVHVFTSTFEV